MIPKTTSIAPPVNKIDAIKLGQPNTAKPQLNAPTSTQIDNKSETSDINSPITIANRKGLPENEMIMSAARLSRFLIVYPGFPLNL